MAAESLGSNTNDTLVTVGSYRNLQKLDSGGFGTVFSGEGIDGKPIAVKRLNLLNINPKEKERFIREVKIQSSLSHKNIVPIIDFDLDCTNPWFVMPLAYSNLRSILEETSKNHALALEVFEQIISGIEFTHKQKIIHRDLKPENILLMKKEMKGSYVCISDFGLGKRLDKESVIITSSNQWMGTAAYSPPEQFQDLKACDERSDIFSLGKILYELLTNDFPIHVNPRNKKIKGGFEYIISKCLESEPENRYQSISELKNMIILIKKEKDFLNVKERCVEIIARLNDQASISEEEVYELDGFLKENLDDSDFMLTAFPKINSALMDFCLKYHFTIFFGTIESFCGDVEKCYHNFSYCDTLGNFLCMIYRSTDDLNLKKTVFSALLKMAHSHSRFYVGELIGKLLSGLKEKSEILSINEKLKENISAAKWCKSYIKSGGVPGILSKTIESE